MGLSERNYAIMSHLFETAAVNPVVAPYMSFENVDDVWALAEQIEAPTITFRIAQIFSFIFYYLPASWTRWYINELKAMVQQFRIRFIQETKTGLEDDSAAKQALAPLERRVDFTTAIFVAIKMVRQLQTNLKAAKAELLQAGYSEGELNCACSAFFRQHV
ncbi:MAG TPA: hypothetical protein VN457_08180, partial [Chlamydiales bacterium]|nr:hypothetical protein [Chlamydiales bacterium]